MADFASFAEIVKHLAFVNLFDDSMSNAPVSAFAAYSGFEQNLSINSSGRTSRMCGHGSICIKKRMRHLSLTYISLSCSHAP